MHKAKWWVLCIFVFLLSGCRTPNTPVNTPGAITSGNTIVTQPGNAETPATLRKSTVDTSIKHSSGDQINIDPSGTINIITQPGTTTVSRIENVDANTGQSREDPTLKITAVLSNTKYIQYAGIALTILGVVLVVIFKVKIQALYLSALGVGMIVLQSQLANPVWSWILIIGIVILPAFWLFHLWNHHHTNISIVEAVEEFRKKRPDAIEDLENILSRKMDRKSKTLIKEAKRFIKN